MKVQSDPDNQRPDKRSYTVLNPSVIYVRYNCETTRINLCQTAASRRPLTARGLVFHARQIHVGFVVEKVAVGEYILRVLRLTPAPSGRCFIVIFHLSTSDAT